MDINIGTIVKISVLKQQVEYKNIFGSVVPTSSTGSGWVVDLKELLSAGIPFIGEPFEKSLPEDEEMINKRLTDLGFPKTENGKFLVIVTNMHVVAGFKSASFQIEGKATTFKTQRVITFQDRDLALIVPDSDSFEYFIPCQISTKYVKKGEKLSAYGYPNGKELCVSKGDLKRIMRMNYCYSNQSLLGYEMTAPINPGDSGGPVFNGEGKVVAITHQHVLNAQAQFNSIPVTQLVVAVRNYYVHGRDTNVLTLPINFTSLLNISMREFYQAPKNDLGILVDQVSKQYESPFEVGDILVTINGLPINAQGHVAYGDTGDMVSFLTFTEFCNLGQEVSVDIIRKGMSLKLNVPLNTPLHSINIVPSLPPLRAPHAFYRHGFAFVELNNGMGKAYTVGTQNQIPMALFNGLRRGDGLKSPDLQGLCYVLLITTLAEGYSNKNAHLCVTDINGIKIRDIWHAQRILDNMSEDEKFVRVHCSNNGSVTPTFILPRLNKEQESENQNHFSISESYSRLPESKLSKKNWQLIRERVNQGFFKLDKGQDDSMVKTIENKI